MPGKNSNVVFLYRIGMPEDRIRRSMDYLRSHKLDTDAMMNLARAYFDDGRPDDAQHTLNNLIINCNTRDTEAHAMKAMIFRATGQDEFAVAQYKLAFTMGYDGGEARKYVAEWESGVIVIKNPIVKTSVPLLRIIVDNTKHKTN